MANKTASIVLDQTATVNGTSVVAPRKTVAVPYQGVINGDLDVPVGATAGSTITVPFGTIAQASGARIQNDTTQDLVLKCGGNTVAAIAPGGMFCIGGPTATGVTGALTAMTLHPTTTQTSVETVGYWIFGDPT